MKSYRRNQGAASESRSTDCEQNRATCEILPAWDNGPANQEQVCKPNSVPRSQIWNFKFEISNPKSQVLWSQIWDRSGDHSSSPAVASRIKRPTRRLQAGSPITPPYLVLHREEFAWPRMSPHAPVRSYI